jgi:hypothetical protein
MGRYVGCGVYDDRTGEDLMGNRKRICGNRGSESREGRDRWSEVKHKTMAQFILVLTGIECFIFVNCTIVLCKTVLGPFTFM